MGSAINQDTRMTAHETTPSDAAIGQAFREALARTSLPGAPGPFVRSVLGRAREIEQGRGAVVELPPEHEWQCSVCGHDEHGFTEEQMTAYGDACRLMDGESMIKLMPLPQAFYDEFGNGADDLVRDYAFACVQSCRRMGNRDE